MENALRIDESNGNDIEQERSSLAIIKAKALSDEEECKRRDEIFITSVFVCTVKRVSLKNILHVVYFILQLIGITIPFFNLSGSTNYFITKCSNSNNFYYSSGTLCSVCNQNLISVPIEPGQSYIFPSTFCKGAINATFYDYENDYIFQLIQTSPTVALAESSSSLNYFYDGSCQFMYLNITNPTIDTNQNGCLSLSANLLLEEQGFAREACRGSAYSAITSLCNTVITFIVAWIKIKLSKTLTLEATKKDKRSFLKWIDPVDNLEKRVYFISRSEDELKTKKRFNLYLDNNSRAKVPYLYQFCRYNESIVASDVEERKLAMQLGLQRQAERCMCCRDFLAVIVSSHYTYYFLWSINLICAVLYWRLACDSSFAKWYLVNMLLNLSFDFSLAFYYVCYYRGTIAFKRMKETNVVSATTLVPAALEINKATNILHDAKR